MADLKNQLIFSFLSLSFLLSIVTSGRLDADISDQEYARVPAKKTDFPGFVSIQLKDKHICSGIMLDLDFVLTSSSCLLKANSDRGLSIIGGVVSLLGDSHGDMRLLKRAMGHPDFDTKTLVNDIALLHIKSFEKKDMGNMLTTLKRPIPGKKCTVVAWTEFNEVNLNDILKMKFISTECLVINN